jgi:predicted phage terminase large subunit-like protein
MSTLDPNFINNAPKLLTKVRAEQARRSLKAFIEQSWVIIEPGRTLTWGWPLDAIVLHLEAVARGDIRKLAIFVPPGFMKSRSTRVFYPAWRWVQDPYHKFLSASYGIDLTIRDTLDLRRLITSEWYQDTFGLGIAEDDGGRTGFTLKSLGSIKPITVGGKTTGFRGDTVLFDDIIGVQDANSPSKRAEANEWFRESAQNRVNDATMSSRVLIMQRVHEDDPGALAMKMGYEPLIIPMEWDEHFRHTTSIGWTDPRTVEGELAFPERFPAEEVEMLKDDETGMGAYAYASQYQQTPVPRKGALIPVDKIQMVEKLPEDSYLTVRAWDLAGTAGAGAFTVGVRMKYGRNSRRFFFDDVKRGQFSPGKVRDLILDTAVEDTSETLVILPKDPGQAGVAQIADLTAMLAGFNVKAEAQTGSKEMRAEPMAGQIEHGHVSCLQDTWTKAFIDEMRFFPKGKFVDQIDAAASAFNALAALARHRKRTLQLVVGGERQENYATMRAGGV